jgi:hypothetical protein
MTLLSFIVILGLVPRVQGSAARTVDHFQFQYSGSLDPRHKAEDDGVSF